MNRDKLNRVIAVGRDTYLRAYPNPGVCVCLRKRRIAVSLYGGIEIFERHPTLGWRRIHAWLSRITRPGERI